MNKHLQNAVNATNATAMLVQEVIQLLIAE
jgi:hypothetical protein